MLAAARAVGRTFEVMEITSHSTNLKDSFLGTCILRSSTY